MSKMFKNGVYVVKASEPLKKGSTVELVNSNCEFNFDSYYGCFNDDDNLKTYKIEIIITEEYLDEYVPQKSNNGGCYAYATGVITNIISEA